MVIFAIQSFSHIILNLLKLRYWPPFFFFFFFLFVWMEGIILLCFSMNERDFSVKLKPKISLFQTMKIRLLDFRVGDYFFHLCFMNSWLKVLPKRLKCSIFVWNYGDDVNIPRSNRWHHLLCWSNAFSAYHVRWAVTDCRIFSCLFMVLLL